MTSPMALPDQTAHPRPIERLLSHLCLTAAVLLLRLRFRHVVAVVERLHRLANQPATAKQATRITALIRTAALRSPGRAACLERSLAATLLACIHGRRVDWCIGARLVPYAGHAWIEVDGQPIGEPPEPDRPYQLLRRI